MLEPSGRWDAEGIAATATPEKGGYCLDGTKLFVPDGHIADLLIVAARSIGSSFSEGVSLFCVDASLPGIRRQALKNPSRRNVLRSYLARSGAVPDACQGQHHRLLIAFPIGAVFPLGNGVQERRSEIGHRDPAEQLSRIRPKQADAVLQNLRDQDGKVVFRGDVDVTPTLQRMERGEKLRFSHDGIVFENREQRLPKKGTGYYHEYVHPTPGQEGPGPQEISQGAKFGLQKAQDWLTGPAAAVEFDGHAINAAGGVVVTAPLKGMS